MLVPEPVFEEVDSRDVFIVGLGRSLLDELLVLLDDGLGSGVVDIETPGYLC